MSKIFLYALTAMTMIAVTPAFAENYPKQVESPKIFVHRTYEHQQEDRLSHRYQPNLGRVGELAISDNDRVVLGKYLNHHYKNSCAWEHDLRVKTCVAPQAPAKRSFIIGYALPNDAVVEDVPAKITAHLNPLPLGYKYVRAGNDVVLINASTREVVDGMTLMSLYGK